MSQHETEADIDIEVTISGLPKEAEVTVTVERSQQDGQDEQNSANTDEEQQTTSSSSFPKILVCDTCGWSEEKRNVAEDTHQCPNCDGLSVLSIDAYFECRDCGKIGLHGELSESERMFFRCDACNGDLRLSKNA